MTRKGEVRERTSKEVKAQLRMWKIAKAFIEAEYPRVNVTLVNPLGLQGTGWKEVQMV
jgi:hypothetical protein